jgi:hypothetical protein
MKSSTVMSSESGNEISLEEGLEYLEPTYRNTDTFSTKASGALVNDQARKGTAVKRMRILKDNPDFVP